MSNSVNWAAVAAALETGLGFVEELAPLAALGGRKPARSARWPPQPRTWPKASWHTPLRPRP